jgi:putative inorganic carbon (hco3(-)) transporter
MDFFFLILVTGCLYLRPSEIVFALSTVPFYFLTIVPCIVLSINSLLIQFTGESLRRRPITVCVLGLLLATILSNLSHLYLDALVDSATVFGKVVLYYLLIAGVVNSRRRFSRLMACIVIASFVVTGLAVLHNRGVINHPAFEGFEDTDGDVDQETGELVAIHRLCGPGLFHDPNDMSLILVIGMMFSLCGLGDRRQGLVRLLWLTPFSLFGYALMLTRSRGGFIALMAGLLVLLVSRFGARRAIFLSVVLLPPILIVFGGGRQTTISTSDGTGQSRIQLWMDGLMLFRQAPLFGIGTNQYGKAVGHVAHNSYIHAFTEMGFFGGTLFAGMVYYSLWTVYRLGRSKEQIADPELRRMQPYVMAALTGFSAGMLPLSLCYEMPTYTIFGLATSFIRLANPEPPLPGTDLDGRLVNRLLLVGIVTLAVFYVFTKSTVHWD